MAKFSDESQGLKFYEPRGECQRMFFNFCQIGDVDSEGFQFPGPFMGRFFEGGLHQQASRLSCCGLRGKVSPRAMCLSSKPIAESGTVSELTDDRRKTVVDSAITSFEVAVD